MEDNTNILQGDSLLAFFDNPTEAPKKEINTLDDLFEKEEPTVIAEEPTTVIETPTEKVDNLIKQVEETQKPTESKYKQLIDTLIETGDWDDAYVTIGEEEVEISKLGDVDKELFLQLKQAQDEQKKAKVESSYISVEGVDDNTRKLIEISRNKGDISELLQVQRDVVNPIEQIENDRSDQSFIYLVSEKMKAQGYEPDYIEMKIGKFLKDGTLDLEAQKVIDEVKGNYQAYLNTELEKVKNQALEKENGRKDFRKTIAENLKDYKLKEADYRTLLETASKYDDRDLTEADTLFANLKENDPKRYIEMVMYMKNPELFNDVKLTPLKNKATVAQVKNILNLRPISSGVKTPGKEENLLDKMFKNKP